MSKLQDYLLRRAKQEPKATISHRKIYIIPTKEGVFFALLLLLMLLMAINFSNSLIYLLTFFLAGFAIFSMIYTQLNLLGLQVVCGKAQSVFCGQTIYVPLLISVTDSSKINNLAISLKCDDFLHTLDIGNHSQQVLLPVLTQQRGMLILPTFTIATTYPTGLFYAWSNVNLSSEVLIYPQKIPYLNNGSNHFSEGEDNQSFKAGHNDFYQLKKYTQGHSLKQVHWKMVAKERGMYLKQFTDGQSREHYWLDLQMFDPKIPLETRLSYLSYLVVQAFEQADHYGLRINDNTIAIDSGYHHMHRCLKQLALS